MRSNKTKGDEEEQQEKQEQEQRNTAITIGLPPSQKFESALVTSAPIKGEYITFCTA